MDNSLTNLDTHLHSVLLGIRADNKITIYGGNLAYRYYIPETQWRDRTGIITCFPSVYALKCFAYIDFT